MPDGLPLILGRQNDSRKATSLNILKGLVVTNYTKDGFGLIGVGRGVGVYGAGGCQGIGVYARSDGPQSYSGFFEGNLVVVGGNSTVFWGSQCVAVRHPDQSDRLLHSIGSPECWLEDFGRAKLVSGKTKVMLDRDFASFVRTGYYHVFLTPEGDSKGLYVTSKNGTGFKVREQQSGKSSVWFSYRIVARRKDVRASRLPRVERPPVVYYPPWEG